MKLIYYSISVLLFSFFILQSLAQNNESHKYNISDTSKINHLIKIAETYNYTEPDSARYFANEALIIAQKNNLLNNVVKLYSIIGFSYIVESEYSEATTFLTKALNISKQLIEDEPDNNIYKRSISEVYLCFGQIHFYNSQYDQAINDFIKAVKLLEEIGDEHGAGSALSNISVVYEALNDFSTAIEYNRKALSIAKKNNDNELLVHISNNICVDFIRVSEYDSAYYYISTSIQFNEAKENEADLQMNYLNLARIFKEISIYDSAIFYLNKSEKISTELNYIVGLIDVNYMLGAVYLNKKDYSNAEKHLKKSIKLAKGAGISNSVMNANGKLSNLYKEIGNYKMAYEYFVAQSHISDSIFDLESKEHIANLETKYQSEKKEEEIKYLLEKTELQRVKSNTNLYIFISVIIILILVIVLIIISYRSFKLKQLAEKQKIQQKTEREILDAVIETENKERKRFAEDLHDGLGVLLSTLRLYINEIGDSTTKSDRKNIIVQSTTLIDDAITNARNISNNIMPASIKDSGLEVAIKSAADKINSSGNIVVDVKSLNFKKHYKISIAITLYRILTEMLNNTLKHGNASQIKIVLTEKSNKLLVTYTDDGNGFDYESEIRSSSKGIGLDNMISRVNSIGGKCSIQSSPGKGFSAAIDVPMN
jgi:two-component system, NarL family, sensor kinase